MIMVLTINSSFGTNGTCGGGNVTSSSLSSFTQRFLLLFSLLVVSLQMIITNVDSYMIPSSSSWSSQSRQQPQHAIASSSSSTTRSASFVLFAKNHMNHCNKDDNDSIVTTQPYEQQRRMILSTMMKTTMGTATAATVFGMGFGTNAQAAEPLQDSLDIDNFLRTGRDSGGNMGVSSQTGKSRPVTGVLFRDGTDVVQEKRTGLITAELLTGTKQNPHAILIQFNCPTPQYKLETGPVFDVECRDNKGNGDGIFVAVSPSIGSGSSTNIATIPTSTLFVDRLFGPTGRFSFYGPATDIKIKKDVTEGNKRYLEVNFSNLSQSTNSEIPRTAVIVATLPVGTENPILLVASTNANRWKKNENQIQQSMYQSLQSFDAIPSPKTNLKLRAKDRTNGGYLGDLF